jgi:hypothetical protein
MSFRAQKGYLTQKVVTLSGLKWLELPGNWPQHQSSPEEYIFRTPIKDLV